MPTCKEVIATGETYHIFNKTINTMPIFRHSKICQRMQRLMWFYQYQDPGIKFSRYDLLSFNDKYQFHSHLMGQQLKVQCLSYVLMPNHFHLLATQVQDNGISDMIKSVQSGMSHWYNLGHKRIGPLFLPQFKIVRVESDEKLLHVNRYIHLNPVTGYLVKKPEDIDLYPWSSWSQYLNPSYQSMHNFIDTKPIMNHFASINSYRKFVLDQADYQRSLKHNKHLNID